MADFNASLSGPSAAGANPVAPVQERQIGIDISPLVNLGSNLASIWMKEREQAAKQKKIDMENAVMTQYSDKMSKVASGFASGQLNVNRAKIEQQKVHRQYVAAFPNYVEEFGKLNKQFTEGTELATVKDEFAIQQDLRKANLEDMRKRGYNIPKDASIKQEEAAIEAHAAMVRSEDQMKKFMEQSRFQNEMDASQRAKFEFERKIQVENVLAELGDKNADLLLSQVRDLGGKVQAGQIDPVVAQQELSSYFLPVEKAITAMAGSNPTAANAAKELFSNIKQLGSSIIDPKTTREVSDNQLKLLENRVKFQALNSSPEAKRLFGASYLLNGNIPSIFAGTNKDAMTAYVALGVPYGVSTPQVVGTPDQTKTYDALKLQVDEVQAGRADPVNTMNQVSNAANTLLKQTGNAAYYQMSSKELAPVVDFIGSPQFLSVQKEGKIAPEGLDAAKSAIQAIYEKDVQSGINARLNKEIGGTSGSPVLAKQRIEVKWNGAGVEIGRSDKGAYLNPMETQTRNQFVREMQPITKTLNTVVRAGAHLEGHSNYEQYWEKNKHLIMPEIYPNPERLKVGQVINGFKYLGGNTNNQDNWMREETKESK